MQSISNRLLPLAAAVAVTFSIAACGDRPTTPTAPATSTTATTPSPANTTTASPSNTAAPAAAIAIGGTVATTDREFFALAASSDMLEMETGRLALEKSQNSNVRAFAQKMVDDHTKAAENLREVASSAGVTPAAAMTSTHAAHLEKLSGLSGVEFDREYAAQIGVAGHQEAIGLFERASREAANAEVRALAEKALPGKREHLGLGQTLAKSVGVGADRLRMANAPPDLSSLSATIASRPNSSTSTTGSGSSSGTDVSKSGTTSIPAGVDAAPPASK